MGPLDARPAGQTARERARDLRRAAPNRVVGWLADARTGERTNRVAARAERSVARELSRLDPGWWVLHSIPLGGSGEDVDHLVIGTAGVFVLETRSHPGSEVRVNELAVMADRRETMHLPEARATAQQVSERLSSACGFEVVAQPVVVVLARHLSVKRQPPDVEVVGRRSLVRWLGERPGTQSFETAAAIHFVAVQPQTWS